MGYELLKITIQVILRTCSSLILLFIRTFGCLIEEHGLGEMNVFTKMYILMTLSKYVLVH